MFSPVVLRWAARCALQALILVTLTLPASSAVASSSTPRLQRPPAAPMATALDDSGAWIALAPAALDGHAAIYDPDAGRVVVFGGNSATSGYVNETWMLAPAGTMEWLRVSVDASAIPQRSYASAIHDPVGRRMIVFGGDLGGGSYPTADVCALSLVAPYAWTVLAPAGDPGARMEHAAVYDPVRHRMIVFGGTDGYNLFDDVWTLSLGSAPAWEPMSPAGSPPPARCLTSATYDPLRDRVIVIGGSAYAGGIQDDVWALSLAGAGTWTQLAPGGAAPGPRAAHVAAYDPSGDRVVVYGGVSLTEYLDDAWALSLAGSPSWSQLAPAGDPAPRLAFHAAAYDSHGDRLVAVGGIGVNGYPTCETWALSLGASPTWTRSGSPGFLERHTMTADPERDRAIVFGGVAIGTATNAVWSLALSGPVAWTPLAPAGTPPAARSNHSAVCDEPRDRLLAFGGDDGAWSVFGDVWALSLGAPLAWTLLAPSGTPPAARASHTAVLDPVRERMIVFGGRTLSGARQDVWALSLSGAPAWSNLSPFGTPPPARWNHVAIYDPVGDRMIVHGGESSTQWFDDTWALGLSGTPAWTQLAPGGDLPPARSEHSALFDPLDPRMIVTGGSLGTECEVWELSLDGPLEWTRLFPGGPPMPGRVRHEQVYDADRDRLVLFGGSPGAGDLWALSRGPGGVGVPVDPPTLSLAAAWAPNPALGGASLALVLPSAGRVELRLFDVSGRLVRAMDFGLRGAGAQRFTWDGRDDAGRPLPPGLYLGEVRTNDRVARAGLALVR